MTKSPSKPSKKAADSSFFLIYNDTQGFPWERRYKTEAAARKDIESRGDLWDEYTILVCAPVVKATKQKQRNWVTV